MDNTSMLATGRGDMTTKVWRVLARQTTRANVRLCAEQLAQDSTGIREAAAALRSGQVVAFPTETVYGLGGNACDDDAVRKIFAAKGRPADNPLIVHVGSEAQLERVVGSTISAQARLLMDSFWPGPLTLVLPLSKDSPISRVCSGGLSTVGVRMPNHAISLALLLASDCPIAAPSANTSGRPSPTMGSHVLDDLNGRIAGVVVDADDTRLSQIGVESTVLDMSNSDSDDAVILRPGGVTQEQLQEALGPDMTVSLDPALTLSSAKTKAETDQSTFVPKAPGMKYTHYAPQAPLYLYGGGSVERFIALIRHWVTKQQKHEESAGHEKSTADRLLQHNTHENTATATTTATTTTTTTSTTTFTTTSTTTATPTVGVLVTTEHLMAVTRATAGLPVTVLPLGSLSSPSDTAHALFAALRSFDSHSHRVSVILSETVPPVGVGLAVMNRLEKAAGAKYLT